MNRDSVNRIANAVLYEGYILYPYRPSVKNRQRWTFGGLYPETYCAAVVGESSSSQTECLVHGDRETVVEAVVRFLHLTARQVGESVPPLPAWPCEFEPRFRPVDALRVGERLFHTWQEAQEREVPLGELTLGDLLAGPRLHSFAFVGGRRWEPLCGPLGDVVGALKREQKAIEGAVEASAVEVSGGLYRVTLRVSNWTAFGEARGRDDALLHALVSAHVLLGVRGGEFVSLLDPPEDWRKIATGCRNIGTFPVLVGQEGQTDTMLSSPIILYDYPQVAAESPGDFFDGTEIDEMLTLRILTLTDHEKKEMAAVDERASALLARTEAMARDQLLGLHGTVRDWRLAGEDRK